MEKSFFKNVIRSSLSLSVNALLKPKCITFVIEHPLLLYSCFINATLSHKCLAPSQINFLRLSNFYRSTTNRRIHRDKPSSPVQRNLWKALAIQHEGSSLNLPQAPEISDSKRNRNHQRKSEELQNMLPCKLQRYRAALLNRRPRSNNRHTHVHEPPNKRPYLWKNNRTTL